MAVNLSLFAGAGAQFFNDNGVPLAGGLIYTYLAGTTTPVTTYTSSTGLIAHANPIVLNAAGRISTGEIWITVDVAYKFVLKDASFVQIGSYDNIPSYLITNATGIIYNQGSAGAVNTTAQAKFQEFVSVKDFGAIGNGIANDTAAFQNVNAYAQSSGATVNVPTGTYNLTSDVTPAINNYKVSMDAGVTFPNKSYNLINGTKTIGAAPTLSYDLIYRKVDSSFNNYAHVVGQSIFLEGTSPNAVSVGLYANAEVAAVGHSGFGANIGTFVTANGIGVACEIDTHVTDPNGLAYGLAIDAIGTYPSEAAIVIQNNNATAWYRYGISFNNANGTGTISPTGSAIYMNAGILGYYIQGLASAAISEISLPSFVVGPTPASINGIIRIDGSNAANPSIAGFGSAALISPVIKSKGDGSSLFLNVDGATVLRTTGLSTNVDYIKMTNGSAGATIGVDGTSANADLVLETKGIGKLRYGTVVAQGDTATIGYVVIKDSVGNNVKLAVIS